MSPIQAEAYRLVLKTDLPADSFTVLPVIRSSAIETGDGRAEKVPRIQQCSILGFVGVLWDKSRAMTFIFAPRPAMPAIHLSAACCCAICAAIFA